MNYSDLKIGQKVKWMQDDEESSWNNYSGASNRKTKVEYTGRIKEIVSKTLVIVEDSGGDEHPVEPRKLKLIQDVPEKKLRKENLTTIKKSELRQIIKEEIFKVIKESPLDFDMADSIASGTRVKPERPSLLSNPNTVKKIEIINKFTSKPFDYEDTIDLFNNLGPITPKELDKINMSDELKYVDFEIEGYGGYTNLSIHSKNYKDKGVAITFNGDNWEQ
jgi:hypothetical protein